MSLPETIKTLRPKLSDGSVKTYTSILKNLFLKCHPDTKEINLKWFHEQEPILKHLEKIPPQNRKTILSALIVISPECNNLYKAQMNEDLDISKAQLLKQEKTETQKKNWITPTEIDVLFRQNLAECKTLWKKPVLTSGDFQKCQNVIILALLSGVFINVRRSLDYTEFKIRNIDEEKDNFLKGKTLYFNRYKTAKFKGLQTIPNIPAPLVKLLKQWIAINKHDYLLVDTLGNKLNPVKLNQRLNGIFGGRHISVNILRHVSLTDKYKDIPALTDLLQTAEEMGHSLPQALEYIKR